MAKAITVRLDPSDYDRLESEADRLGMAPGTLARVYVRTGLAGKPGEDWMSRRSGLTVLARLKDLRSHQTETADAVALVREGRRELSARGSRARQA